MGYRPAPGAPFVYLSYGKLIERSKNFGAGLLALGGRTDCEYLVGIFAKTCVEWTLVENGCLAYGMVTAPLYDSLGHEACQQLIEFCKRAVFFCD